MFKATKSFRFITFLFAATAIASVVLSGSFGSSLTSSVLAQETVQSAKAASVNAKGGDPATVKEMALDVPDLSAPSVPVRGDGVWPKATGNPDSPLAALTGTKNIPGDYADLTAAIADLNAQGVGAGGVTFNVVAANPQTAPVGGYIIGGAGSLVLTTSSAANPITFTGNANVVTASSGQTAGSLVDGVFKLVGADWVTIQGFTIQESATNTITAAATNNMTEWGVALLYVTATDGSQNNTIQNNTISLNRTYQNTFGIYSNTRHTSTTATVTAEATAASGSNSNNKIYGNQISNVDYGIVFVGASVTANMDTGNDIGGIALGTGNTITNWGWNAVAISSYISVTGSNFCVYLNHQLNDNASFNTITSAVGLATTTTQHGGILKAYSTAAPAAGTVTTTNLNNNTVTINNSPTTGQMSGISAQGFSGLTTATINVNNNLVSGSVSGAAATSAAFLGIFTTAGPGTLNITGNTVRGVTTNATTGSFTGIQNQTGGVVTTLNINNNKIGDSIAGAVTFTGTANSGAAQGIINTSTGAAATSAVVMTGNDIRGITYSVAGSGANTYLSNASASLSQNISNNTFTNLNVNTTGSVTFISNNVTVPATGTQNVNNNSIVTAFNKAGAGGTVTLFTSNASSASGSVVNNNNNNFSNITVTGATTIAGWSNTDGGSPTKNIQGNTFSNWAAGTSSVTALNVTFSGTANVSSNTISAITSSGAITPMVIGSSNTTANVFKNKIYDITANTATGTVSGLTVSGGLTNNIYNNLIGDLKAPAATVTAPASAVIGINVSSTTTSSNVNVSFNSVYLNASSSGANFATSGISHAASSTATTATLNLRNNIIYNTSTAAGTGLTVAYRRSVGTAGTLANYGSTSNGNDFYAGTPSATNLIYSDGTSVAQTMVAYKTGVFTAGTIAPRDSASFSEAPNFLSTVGSNANFLHIDTTIATQLESGGSTVAGITDDVDGDVRNVSTPDVGADEFTGVLLDLSPPVISYTPLGNQVVTPTQALANVTITDATGVNGTAGTRPRVYYKKSGHANTFADNTSATDGWKFVEANGATSQFDFTIDYSLLFGGGGVAPGDNIQYFVVAQDTATTPNVGINSGTFAAAPTSVALTSAAFPLTGTINSYNIASSVAGPFSVGAGQTYTSLTNTGGIFEFINNNVVTGPITITLTSDLAAGSGTLVAETGTVALNQFAAPHTVTIQGAFLIEGAASGGLIRLNGADAVTINGTGGMRIRNTASGPAITFINDATGNTVNSTIVESANTSTSSGTILFSTSNVVSSPLGNSNNLITASEIRDRSDAAGVPANAVFSSGTAGAPNASNTVSGCNVYNFTNAGVLVSATGAGNGWTINPSSFYQTAARTTAMTGISIQGGSGHSILNNSIGGGAPGAGGAFLATTQAFRGIDLTVGTTPATSVQGNTVKNIRSTLAGSFTASYGIFVQAGTVNMGTVTGNTVGSSNVAERYEISGDSYGIRAISTTAVNVSNNTINNFTTAAGVPTGEFYFGMSLEGTGGAHSAINNTITNVSNGSTPDASFNTQTIGLVDSATGIQTIRGNTISNIGSTSVAAVTSLNNRVWGLVVGGGAAGTVVEKNKISGIYGSSPTAGARADIITALQSQGASTATYSNNMVAVDGGGASSDRSIFGILELSTAANNYYFNSVNVTGTATAANSTYAFNRNSVSAVSIRDNIFADSRTGGTGFHVAMANTNAAATGWSATSSNNNLLFNATPAHVTQWLGSLVANNRDLATFKTDSGGDAATTAANPLYTSATDLHILGGSPAVNTGVAFGGITTDIDNQTRPLAGGFDIGADEVELYTVGGTVSGLSGTGLVLQNNAGNDLAISANGAFTFTTALAPGAGYAVTVLTQPGGPTQTCTVTNGSGTIAAANVTNVTVTCVTNTYTVGGTVSGLAGSGLVLQNNAGDNLPVAANGSFTFATPVASGGTYAVTVLTQPSAPTQTCVVTSGSGSVTNANITNVSVTCTTNSYTIGGTVSGLNGTGLTLRNNGGDDLPITADGAFTFSTPVASGATYAVTVFTQPSLTSPELAQTCTVTNGSGTVGAGNVTNVSVACTTNNYTVGGTVSGLSGSGLVLQNNGGNNTPITADGAFTFSTSIASGGSYAVTVLTQPGTPTQTCVVTNGSGTVTNANITNVSVTCTTNTYTVGGTVTGLTGTGLVIQNNGGNNTPIAADGAFTFSTPVASGATYAVTVLTQPTGPIQSCAVTNGSGTITNANITNVTITCTTPAFVEFASATYREDESQTAQIRLVRTGNTSIVSTVQVSTTSGGGNPGTGGTCGTAGVDYGTITNQNVVFNSGDSEAFATVQICTGDTVVEIPDETASLSMSIVSGASAGTQTSAVLSINDTASQFLQAIPHDPINMFFATVANPYPSQIVVAGAPNIVGTMRVTLYDVSHANP
ncbi:MAG TPA: choice-of-anchor Q domain-containing protein, partial [Pyrinomonadaceae bacterium]|nr:choice-of-anchor Q domain-containing protein [Pyrinomonadaceae bacterium]